MNTFTHLYLGWISLSLHFNPFVELVRCFCSVLGVSVFLLAIIVSYFFNCCITFGLLSSSLFSLSGFLVLQAMVLLIVKQAGWQVSLCTSCMNSKSGAKRAFLGFLGHETLTTLDVWSGAKSGYCQSWWWLCLSFSDRLFWAEKWEDNLYGVGGELGGALQVLKETGLSRTLVYGSPPLAPVCSAVRHLCLLAYFYF